MHIEKAADLAHLDKLLRDDLKHQIARRSKLAKARASHATKERCHVFACTPCDVGGGAVPVSEEISTDLAPRLFPPKLGKMGSH